MVSGNCETLNRPAGTRLFPHDSRHFVPSLEFGELLKRHQVAFDERYLWE